MIKFKNVEKRFGTGTNVLKNVNINFKEGEINVLIGPSGCGKTTTMKLVNRLIEQTEGSILIDEQDIKMFNPISLRRKTGYVIQDIGLFPHMTIFENVSIILKLLKWDKTAIKNRVRELLNMVNLDPDIYLNRYPSELSGGQQQRIGVIRALAAEPPTILMDEPFSALDPISREELQEELKKLQKEIKKTIIFVTHDMDEALKIADQIILMNEGEVVQIGPPDELLQNPKSPFVRDFIGEERIAKSKDLPLIREVLENKIAIFHEEDNTSNLFKYMTTNNIGFLPILNKNDEFIGQISLYTIAQNMNKKVSECNYLQNATVSLDDHLSKALYIMQEKNSDVIVLDSNQQLVGTLTKGKLLKILHSYYETKSGVKL